ncbi:Uncharacterised protein [Pluralibacter gergoviae]|nr:Uncharacterised protein [Pluralibacter gergoviae]
MLNFPIGSSSPSRYRGATGSAGGNIWPAFSFAPALREGFKICLLFTAFWIPLGKGLGLSLDKGRDKAKALSKAKPIAGETPCDAAFKDSNASYLRSHSGSNSNARTHDLMTFTDVGGLCLAALGSQKTRAWMSALTIPSDLASPKAKSKASTSQPSSSAKAARPALNSPGIIPVNGPVSR